MKNTRSCWLKSLLGVLFISTALVGTTVLAGPKQKVEHEAITIWSDGVRLAGDIFKPQDIKPGTKLPGLLLVHGWGGTKDHLNRAYAPQFAELGFIVLSFDFKGWGESNGPLLYRDSLPAKDDRFEVEVKAQQIRRVVNPRSMVEDTRAALNYLAGEPQVLSDNIGIWGTSLGGGIALVTAARDDRIKAYVDQIGAVNFKANLKSLTDEMTQRWEVQRARGEIDPYSGPESVINPALKGYPDWIYLKRFDSFASAKDLKVPTLIIDAEEEELFASEVNGGLLYKTIKDKIPSRYVSYPGKHYDIYRGDAYKNALRDAQEWFITHLKDDKVAAGLYKTHCANCHSNPVTKAPPLGTLKSLGYQRILGAITTGNMQAQASAMAQGQHQALARYLSKDSADPWAWEAPMACAKHQSMEKDIRASVSNWGYGSANHRFQELESAGLQAKDLPNLELAWAQGFPGTTSMRSQPVITQDTLFVGVDGTSSVYALDLASGCLRWSYRSSGPVRTALNYSTMPGTQQPILVFGDALGSVHVINALDGSKIWSASAKLGKASTLTGTPVIEGDRLYVPISSFEVAKATMGTYECCREHGGVSAFDLRSGDIIWTWHSTAEAKQVGKNSIGTPSWGPSGAPVWTTPAIDTKRNRLYIGTGENYSWPASSTSDSIVALDLDSGEQLWVFQALTNDVYTQSCVGYLGYPEHPNCPENPGPDFDFGASVIIAKDSAGRELLLAGQKSGDVYALDPDAEGAIIWQNKLSDGTPIGGVHWGMSIEDNTLFVPLADPDWGIKSWPYKPKPGIAALEIGTGKIKWRHFAQRGCELDPSTIDPISGRQEESWPDCFFAFGYSGAPISIDNAVLAGSLNGTLTAFSSENGKALWQFDTKKEFETLNGVKARGGSMDNAGPAIGNGHVIVQSGYSYFNQMPGNVLLVLKKPAD